MNIIIGFIQKQIGLALISISDHSMHHISVGIISILNTAKQFYGHVLLNKTADRAVVEYSPIIGIMINAHNTTCSTGIVPSPFTIIRYFLIKTKADKVYFLFKYIFVDKLPEILSLPSRSLSPLSPTFPKYAEFRPFLKVFPRS